MQANPLFLVIRMLIAALYCGGLLIYFYHVGGSVQGVIDLGLGPYMLGLAIVGLIFCIPLLVALIRILIRPRPRGPSGRGPDDDGNGFDADAVVARYIAERSAQAAAPPSPTRNGAPKPTGFGRRNR